MERSAEESDVAADRLAAGKSADGLVDYCLEDRSRQILLSGALVDQGLNVGLGKNAIWSMKEPVPPAQIPFMRCSTFPFSK